MPLDPTLTTAFISGTIVFNKGLLGAAGKDAWEKLKPLLSRESARKVTQSVEMLQASPDSEPHQAVVKAELEKSELASDPEFLAILAELEASLANEPSQEVKNVIHNVSGIVVVGDGNIVGSTVTLGGAEDKS